MNQGRCLAGASEATLYVNGIAREHNATPALEPGESTDELTFDHVVSCPCGDTLNITVCADNDNGGVIEESNETNNCEVNIVECPCPDLVITDIWRDGSMIYYNIKNEGNAAAPRSYCGLLIDGRFKIYDDVKRLVPGESSTESFWDSWRCTSPYDIIKVCADYVEQIAEYDEDNRLVAK